jgi:prepilin-type processing-associated H-X9-DG protein
LPDEAASPPWPVGQQEVDLLDVLAVARRGDPAHPLANLRGEPVIRPGAREPLVRLGRDPGGTQAGARRRGCRNQFQRPWAPLNCRFSATAKGFVSRHPGGAGFLFADGSVHFLKKGIDHAAYNALGSRNGGEVIRADSY